MHLLQILLFTVCTAAAFTFTSTTAQNHNQNQSPWRPLLDFFRGPRSAHAHPPPRPVRAPAPSPVPGHIRAHAHSHGERYETSASQYLPAPGSYYTRNTFSHPFAHYRGPPPQQQHTTYARVPVPSFTPIPNAPRVIAVAASPSPLPTYASYQHQQPIYVTAAAPTVNYEPQRMHHVYAPIYVTAAPPQPQGGAGYDRAPAVEPVTARAPPADFMTAAREHYQYQQPQQQQQQQRPSFDSSRDSVVTPARSPTANRYQSDTQISSQALTPERDNQYHDFEREILGNVQQVQSQVQSDSQSFSADSDRDEQRDEAPRLTPANIRLVYHNGDDDEQEVRMTLREKSRNANEDATFIVAPPRSIHQKQKIMLPPAPQPVVYILLRKPVITSEVKYERQEAEEGKKGPKVYITYDDVSQVVSKHIDLATGKVKPHGPDEKV